MNPINETEHGVQGPRTDGPSRRSVLQALAASGALAGLGVSVSAQEDHNGESADTASELGIPVAGSFPAGETVGLRKVAESLPAPTDLEYVEVDGEVYHYIATQTGQIYVTNLHEDDEATPADDPEEGPPEDDPEAAEPDDDGPAESTRMRKNLTITRMTGVKTASPKRSSSPVSSRAGSG